MPTLVDRTYDMGVISNSETSQYQTCQRRHYYNFGLKLEPKRMSDSLTRGIIGHEALAAYYLDIKQYGTKGYDRAVASAMSVIDAYMEKDITENGGMNLDMLSALRQRVNDYLAWASFNDNFEILEVEQEYRLDLPNGMQYAMRLDLLVRPYSGPYVGKVVLIDHKFVYDFYSEDKLAMNAQMPKYIGILRASGRPVDVAILNQIRTRVNKKSEMTDDQKFRREVLLPTSTEVQTIFAEEIKVAEQIEFFKSLSIEQWESEVTRTMGNMTCGYCPFTALCKAELQGQDTSVMREMDYKALSYGYKEIEA